jgi:hypothetical protein
VHRFIDFSDLPELVDSYLMQALPVVHRKPAQFWRAIHISFFGFLLLAFVQKWSPSQSQAPGCISIVGMVDSIGWLLFASLSNYALTSRPEISGKGFPGLWWNSCFLVLSD